MRILNKKKPTILTTVGFLKFKGKFNYKSYPFSS